METNQDLNEMTNYRITDGLGNVAMKDLTPSFERGNEMIYGRKIKAMLTPLVTLVIYPFSYLQNIASYFDDNDNYLLDFTEVKLFTDVLNGRGLRTKKLVSNDLIWRRRA
jgi:hypothetical protein